MKKSYLMIAAAALLVACSSNDAFQEVDVQDVAIGFSSQAVDKGTRAEMTMTWLKTIDNAFGVYGFKGAAGATGTTNLFTNEQVKYQNVSTGYDDWRHPTIRFWDKSATNYNFYAYAPYNAYNVEWDNTKGFSFTGLPIIQSINNANADLVVAEAQENYSYAQCQTDHTAVGFDPENVHPEHANPANGYVSFVFKHILSKLSFKVKTHDDYSNIAVFTVKAIKLNFPTLNTETANYGVAWNETSKSAVAGTTSYTGYTLAETTGTITYETTVYDDATGQGATKDAENIGNVFIVTPVNTTVTGHAFGIEVTYDVQYKKENPDNAGQYIDDVFEGNCKATGTIAGTTYTPNQNDYWTITIDINPATIEFCVDQVDSWTPVDGGTVEVE